MENKVLVLLLSLLYACNNQAVNEYEEDFCALLKETINLPDYYDLAEGSIELFGTGGDFKCSNMPQSYFLGESKIACRAPLKSGYCTIYMLISEFECFNEACTNYDTPAVLYNVYYNYVDFSASELFVEEYPEGLSGYEEIADDKA